VLLREVSLGAGLGLVLLGIGGRVAMRVVALSQDQPPVLSGGGTLTVVAAGAAAGAVGALLHALVRLGTRSWRGPGLSLLRLTLFVVLLALVTARGLHGSPGPTWLFWLLVAAYAAALQAASRGAHTPPGQRHRAHQGIESADMQGP
jgi:hypothetical protein